MDSPSTQSNSTKKWRSIEEYLYLRSQSTPGNPQEPGDLDNYTNNLSLALSVEKRLLLSYTGALFRIRRDSDNAELDIGYIASTNLADTSAITAFVGSNSAYVTKIYDQTGLGRDLVQTTNAVQPRIVNAGTLETNGAYFNGADYMDVASATQANYTDGSNVQVVANARTHTNGNYRMFDFGPDQISAWVTYGGSFYWDAPYPGARISGTADPSFYDVMHTLSFERCNTSSVVRVDGTEAVTGTVSGTISGTSIFRFGATTGGSGLWDGWLKTLAVWKDCVTPADRAAALAVTPPPGSFAFSSVQLGDTTLNVSWSPASNATSYRVEWSASSNMSGLSSATTGSSSYTITGLNSSQKYYYRVYAVNDNTETEWTDAVLDSFTIPIPAYIYSGGNDGTAVFGDPNYPFQSWAGLKNEVLALGVSSVAVHQNYSESWEFDLSDISTFHLVRDSGIAGVGDAYTFVGVPSNQELYVHQYADLCDFAMQVKVSKFSGVGAYAAIHTISGSPEFHPSLIGGTFTAIENVLFYGGNGVDNSMSGGSSGSDASGSDGANPGDSGGNGGTAGTGDAGPSGGDGDNAPSPSVTYNINGTITTVSIYGGDGGGAGSGGTGGSANGGNGAAGEPGYDDGMGTPADGGPGGNGGSGGTAGNGGSGGQGGHGGNGCPSIVVGLNTTITTLNRWPGNGGAGGPAGGGGTANAGSGGAGGAGVNGGNDGASGSNGTSGTGGSSGAGGSSGSSGSASSLNKYGIVTNDNSTHP